MFDGTAPEPRANRSERHPHRHPARADAPRTAAMRAPAPGPEPRPARRGWRRMRVATRALDAARAQPKSRASIADAGHAAAFRRNKATTRFGRTKHRDEHKTKISPGRTKAPFLQNKPTEDDAKLNQSAMRRCSSFAFAAPGTLTTTRSALACRGFSRQGWTSDLHPSAGGDNGTSHVTRRPSSWPRSRRS
jgi:hypothetical protein